MAETGEFHSNDPNQGQYYQNQQYQQQDGQQQEYNYDQYENQGGYVYNDPQQQQQYDPNYANNMGMGVQEVPGEGGYGYYQQEYPGEGAPFYNEYAEEAVEDEEEEDVLDQMVEEEEEMDLLSFLELITEFENNIDPQTALASILALQELIKSTEFPRMKKVRSYLHAIGCGIAVGGPEIRAQAIDMNVYQTIMCAWSIWCNSGVSKVKHLSEKCSAVRHFAMKAMVAVTPGFSDVLDDLGAEMIMQGLASNVPLQTQLEALRVIRNVCIKSEKNRERFSDSPGFFDSVCHLIKRSEGEELEKVVREWCGAVKTLMLNDDDRVSYNQAPERKRIIFQHKILPTLAQFLANEWGVPTMNAIIVVLATFAINEDYCLHIELGGLLASIHRLITTPEFISSHLLMRNTLSCLRYMVSSEEIRSRAATIGMIRYVLKVMQFYRGQPDLLEVAMSCCAFLTMSNSCQTALFISLGGVNMFIDIMKRNMENIYLLKGGISTLRAVAVNGQNKGRRAILSTGGEELLNGIAKAFPELKYNYVKPAFADLGVELPNSSVWKEEPIVEVLKPPSPDGPIEYPDDKDDEM